jgi:amino acid adenylation domain-containing protein
VHPVDRTVPALVALQAAKAPNALAVSDDSLSITYAELEARANALAFVLRSKGLGRDTVAGVCIARTVAQLVSALAVMKAGAAYLPLDPEQPRDRLVFALRDAGVEIVLTAGAGLSAQTLAAFDNVAVHADGSLAGEPPAGVDTAVVELEDLAYVIYTSGSTGTPKGVEITHAGLSNLEAWHRQAFDIHATDRASHLSAVGFDAAVWEVWPYLCAGASVCIARDQIAREPGALVDWLVANAITIGFVSTPMAERLMDWSYPPELTLRVMLTGADTLHRYPPASLPFALYNNYGPTEATVVATSGRVEAGGEESSLPSIGRPIANTDVFILGENGQVLGAGDEGEIALAGAGLAKGYRGRPDLTAQKFVWIALEGAPPMRMYRTGDRGRRGTDGQIAFLGRLDDQLKIRGFRVEPSEIEAALHAHGGVLESAVVAREFGPGDTRLVAYIVPQPGPRLVHSELTAFLAARLPAYMLPAVFVELAALPLTSNGKVDRAALRVRDMDVSSVDLLYVAPRTTTEVHIAQLVGALLKVDRVSVDGDFFKLGGHSLLGTQLIARLRDAFGVRVGLRFLFESPTIAALAAEVERLSLERLGTAAGDASRAPQVVGGSAPSIPERRA